MSDELLRVRDWDRNFETHESRKLKRLGWVAIPNDLADIRYRMLIEHPEGAAHFGAWVAIVEVASACKERGVLSDGGVALSARHLSMKSGLPEAVFATAIPRLLELGWIERSADVPGESPDVPGKTSAYITETETLQVQEQEQNICASDDARLGDPLVMSIDEPPFSTTEPDALFSDVSKPDPQRERRAFELQQDAWFQEWWGAYWLKKSRKRSREAFGKHVRTDALFNRVMTATREQSAEMLSREPAHRPHGATWLNGERWEDEPAPQVTPKRGAQSSAIDEAVREIYGEQ